jgi:hypothetical protein
MVELPTQRPKRSRSLTVTRKGQVTLRKDLLAHLGIQPGQRIDVEVLPIGLLAGRSSHCASLEELNQAAAAGWAGLGDAADVSWAASSWPPSTAKQRAC